MRPTLSEQSTDYAITQDVAADARAERRPETKERADQ